MAFMSTQKKEINCKIVYYGPPRCGKSTSLRFIYNSVKKGAKGEMISLSQEDDRTLYFDFVPLSLGTVRGYDVRLHLYTVPGDAGYKQSRALISKGVDGIVFMADSQLEMMDTNIKSLSDLKEILANDGHSWGEIPVIFQYNKRDTRSAIPISELDKYLNEIGSEKYETVATTGEGVFDAFKGISKAVLMELNRG